MKGPFSVRVTTPENASAVTALSKTMCLIIAVFASMLWNSVAEMLS